jgi:hypothetical protein
MIYFVSGVLLLVVTGALYVWLLPQEDQAGTLPAKWGMATLLPLAIMCLGIAGLVLVAKGLLAWPGSVT